MNRSDISITYPKLLAQFVLRCHDNHSPRRSVTLHCTIFIVTSLNDKIILEMLRKDPIMYSVS